MYVQLEPQVLGDVLEHGRAGDGRHDVAGPLAVLVEMQGQQAQDLLRGDVGAVRADRRDAVGVTVQDQADVITPGLHAPDDALDVLLDRLRAAAAEVGVGLGTHQLEANARALEHVGDIAVAAAVHDIHQDPEPRLLEDPGVDVRTQEPDVVLGDVDDPCPAF